MQDWRVEKCEFPAWCKPGQNRFLVPSHLATVTPFYLFKLFLTCAKDILDVCLKMLGFTLNSESAYLGNRTPLSAQGLSLSSL